jgi:hypothetical protein
MDDRIIDLAEHFSALPDAEGETLLAGLPLEERQEVLLAMMTHTGAMAGLLGPLAASVPPFISADDPMLEPEQQMAARAVGQMRAVFWQVMRELPGGENNPADVAAAFQRALTSDPRCRREHSHLHAVSRSACRRPSPDE